LRICATISRAPAFRIRRPATPWTYGPSVDYLPHVGILPADLKSMTAVEPACGEGHMAQALAEYFGDVLASDIIDYRYAALRDFLAEPYEAQSYDYVITNPPFRLAEQFIKEALRVARVGASMLCRSQFVEGIGRHERLFSKTPPLLIAQFAERVPMVAGRLDPASKTATSYSWFHWKCGVLEAPKIVWISPCRHLLEDRIADYGCPADATGVA
jgi:hypothetical protein